MGAQGGDDLQVVLRAAAHGVVVEAVQGPQDGTGVHEGVHDTRQHVAARGPDDQRVEAGVQAVDQVEVLVRARQGVGGHLLRRGLQLVELRVADPGGRQPRGQSLDVGAKDEDVLEVLGAEVDDPGALVGGDVHETLRRQVAEGLADRRAGDTEGLGQLDLAEPGPRGVVAAQDHRPHRVHRGGPIGRVHAPLRIAGVRGVCNLGAVLLPHKASRRIARGDRACCIHTETGCTLYPCPTPPSHPRPSPCPLAPAPGSTSSRSAPATACRTSGPCWPWTPAWSWSVVWSRPASDGWRP